MLPRTSRTGLWSALSLAVPAILAAAWAFLEPGGLVEGAEEQERRAAERAVRAAEVRVEAAMRERAEAVPVALELDDARRVTGPFRARASEPDEAVVSLAERTALVRAAAGDREGALPFFARARERGELTRIGLLQYGNVLAATDPVAALALLEPARATAGEHCCGPLPFAALLLAAEVRWSRLANAALRESHRSEALAALSATPAAHVPAMAAELALDEATLRSVAATARAANALATASVGTEPRRLPDLGLLVPLDDRRVAVLDDPAIATLREDAFATARATEPEYALVPGDDAAATFATEIRALAETWSARANSLRASTALRATARASLVLSLVTLVLGNLLVWRTNRREAQLVALRSDFVDVVSHELRTPLAALSLKSEMLARGDVPQDRRPHYLTTLHADVLRLQDQVERVLDFGRLQKGKDLRIAPARPRDLVARAVRNGRPALRLAHQRLEVEVPRELPGLACDLDVLARALKNLLENAAKYAPQGSTVAVRAFAQRGEVVVEVADRGPGVPEGERKSIFEPFVRGSNAGSATPGSGLGLALVQAAVVRHGGRVTVHDREGGGALFSIALPSAQPEAS